MNRAATLAAATGLVLSIAFAAIPLHRGATGTVEVEQLPALTTPVAMVEVKQLASPVVEVRQLPLQNPPANAPAGRVEVRQISLTDSDHAS